MKPITLNNGAINANDEYSFLLEKNDHPELDNSTLVSPDEIVLFQSHIGCFQWCVTLGRFEIATAVMTLSQYRVAPRQGHLHQAKRIVGHLKKYKYGAIRIRTGLPDHSKFVDQAFDWMYSVYGSVTEDLPKNAPVPLGKRIVMSTYKDANLYQDWTTGRAVTGVLHFPQWYPSRLVLQATEHSRDHYLWFRFCCCSDCNQSDYRSSNDATLSRCSRCGEVISLRR